MLGFTTQKSAALAARPGWTGASARETRALGERYAGGRRPFDYESLVFDLLLRGPLPGDATAETFRVGHKFGTGKHSVVRWYTVAKVVFPRPPSPLPLLPPLPTVSLDSTTDPADARPTLAGNRLVWTEGGRGPLFAGLRGYAEDPQAGAALFRPEVLARTRALGMDWRMGGDSAFGVVNGQVSPQQMLSLVDHLAWFSTFAPTAPPYRAE